MPDDRGGTTIPPRPDPADPILDSERSREREIARRLVEAAGPSGLLRFDRFMETALYSTGVGFYTEPEAAIGPGGSFYTAAHVTSLFGRTVAERVWTEYEALARPPTFTVVEVGCGDGTLSVDVVRDLAGRLAGAGTIRYVLVDRSPSLRARATDRVESVAEGTAIEVGVADAVASDGPFRGVVIANELLDALPFRRVIRRSGEWRELGVRMRGSAAEWAEGTGPASPPAAELGDAEEGTIAELSPAAEAFVREISDHLIDGVALLLDYGWEQGPLLRDHSSGTLAAVRHHRTMPEPLAHPGLFDLTAHVNFTRIRAAARAAGLAERGFRTQPEALIAWGLQRLTDEAIRAAEGDEEAVRTRLAVKNLLFGFGSFQALEIGPTPAGGTPLPPPPDPSRS